MTTTTSRQPTRTGSRRARTTLLEKLWMSAAGGFDHRDPPPAPDSKGRGHRAVIATVLITITSLLMAVLAVPGAAFFGRVVTIMADRISVLGPNGKVVIPAIAQRSAILAANGDQIATLAGEQNRRSVALAQIAPIARQAVLAIEDARFFEHHGIDTAGLFRAVFANAAAGRVREGGSTITQQLVKNVLVGNQKTFERKLREAQYAIELEKVMTKQQILELYMNETYFGNGAYGIEAAAEYYFATTADKLNAVQSALLAGMIAAPERFDPFSHPTSAIARRATVLRRMADEGMITEAQSLKLATEPSGALKHPLAITQEPYFVDFIKQQILSDSRFGATRQDRAKLLFQGGLKITTTLDLKLQDTARKSVASILNKPGDPAAALVSIDPKSGMVKAMFGGKDFNSEQFNLAIGHNRQAGSAFKPFTLMTALSQGISPGLTLDTPSPLHMTDDLGRPWNPQNYSHHGEGLMNMRKATENSVNSYYVQLIKLVGPEKVVEMAHTLGIQSKLQPVLSLALGTQGVSPYEMASAYGTLANDGIYCKPFTIARVVGATGTELMHNDPVCTRVADGGLVARADNILQGVIERGTGHRNGQIGRPAAGKTGTTDDYTDSWFMGFTPQFATAVWLGFPDSTKRGLHNIHGLPDVFGGSLPAMIWNKFMKVAHTGLPIEPFVTPPPIETVVVPSLVGLSRDEAIAGLKAEGLSPKTVIVVSTYAAGIVADQSPAPGARVEKGSIVTIDVSDGSGNYQPQPSGSPSS